MVENLDLYMARTKASMEKEQQMMERELLMENHLKEACSGATILKGLAIRGTIAQKS